MALVTNTVAASALRGQGVKVTLSQSESVTYLSTLLKGQSCTISQSSNEGVIDSVDYDGNSFIVVPKMPSKRFDGATTGVLSVNDTVSILKV